MHIVCLVNVFVVIQTYLESEPMVDMLVVPTEYVYPPLVSVCHPVQHSSDHTISKLANMKEMDKYSNVIELVKKQAKLNELVNFVTWTAQKKNFNIRRYSTRIDQLNLIDNNSNLQVFEYLHLSQHCFAFKVKHYKYDNRFLNAFPEMTLRKLISNSTISFVKLHTSNSFLSNRNSYKFKKNT